MDFVIILIWYIVLKSRECTAIKVHNEPQKYAAISKISAEDRLSGKKLTLILLHHSSKCFITDMKLKKMFFLCKLGLLCRFLPVRHIFCFENTRALLRTYVSQVINKRTPNRVIYIH